MSEVVAHVLRQTLVKERIRPLQHGRDFLAVDLPGEPAPLHAIVDRWLVAEAESEEGLKNLSIKLEIVLSYCRTRLSELYNSKSGRITQLLEVVDADARLNSLQAEGVADELGENDLLESPEEPRGNWGRGNVRE